jgi:hypothetical protein
MYLKSQNYFRKYNYVVILAQNKAIIAQIMTVAKPAGDSCLRNLHFSFFNYHVPES